MKKIGIYLASSPSCGGTHQYNQLILDSLSQLSQKEYQLVAFYANKEWEADLKEKNIHCVKVKDSIWDRAAVGLWRRMRLPLSQWRKIAHLIHNLTKKMQQEKCDIWIFPSQDGLAYWIPVNHIAVIHDLMHRYEKRFDEVGEKSEFSKREFHYSHTCQYAKAILVDSQLGKSHVMESYQVDSQKCHVLPYVASAPFHQVASKNRDCLAKYNLPKKYLFYPAQFWGHKNHKNLLHAFKRSLQKHSDLALVLVGSPKNAYSEVVDLIHQLELEKHVYILGLVEQDELIALYKHARALIMPTFFGPTNIPPLEAWQLDCPVVISNIYAIKEQLGNGALYFDPNSIDDIADKIMDIWENDKVRETLIHQGQILRNEKRMDDFTKRFHETLNAVVLK